MTLTALSYWLWDLIRAHSIIDDDSLDLRYLKDWIGMKRAMLLSQKSNTGNNIDLANLQEMTIDIERHERMGEYHRFNYYDESFNDVWIGIQKIPAIVENAAGPLILMACATDGLKFPFSVCSYGKMKFSGNRRFNKNMVYVSVRDNTLFVKNYPRSLDQGVLISAVFADPTEVPGFNEDTDDYPISLDLIDAIKNSIFDKDLRVMLSMPKDDENNADFNITTAQ